VCVAFQNFLTQANASIRQMRGNQRSAYAIIRCVFICPRLFVNIGIKFPAFSPSFQNSAQSINEPRVADTFAKERMQRCCLSIDSFVRLINRTIIYRLIYSRIRNRAPASTLNVRILVETKVVESRLRERSRSITISFVSDTP